MVASPTAEATTAKPKTSTVARNRPSGQPNTLDMVVDAITTLNDKKGASIPAIKSYILTKYLTVDPNMLKYRLKKAIEKGIKEDMLTRPKSSADAGASLNGRFRLNKAKLAAMEKAKQPKTKPKTKAEKPKAKKPKPEKSTKSPTKKNAAQKSKETSKTTKKAEAKKPKEGKVKKAKATSNKSPAKKETKVKKNKTKTTEKKTPKKTTTKKSTKAKP